MLLGTLVLKIGPPFASQRKKVYDIEEVTSRGLDGGDKQIVRRGLTLTSFLVHISCLVAMNGIALLDNAITEKGGLAWPYCFALLTAECMFLLYQVVFMACIPPAFTYPVGAFFMAALLSTTPFFADPFDLFKDVQFTAICWIQEELYWQVLGCLCLAHTLCVHIYLITQTYGPSVELAMCYIGIVVAPVKNPAEEGQLKALLRSATSVGSTIRVGMKLPLSMAYKQTTPHKQRMYMIEEFPQMVAAIAYAIIKTGQGNDPRALQAVLVLNLVFPITKMIGTAVLHEPLKACCIEWFAAQFLLYWEYEDLTRLEIFRRDCPGAAFVVAAQRDGNQMPDDRDWFDYLLETKSAQGVFCARRVERSAALAQVFGALVKRRDGAADLRKTKVTMMRLQALSRGCPNLATLKLTGCSNLTEERVSDPQDSRVTSQGLFELFPKLQRIDIPYTEDARDSTNTEEDEHHTRKERTDSHKSIQSKASKASEKSMSTKQSETSIYTKASEKSSHSKASYGGPVAHQELPDYRGADQEQKNTQSEKGNETSTTQPPKPQTPRQTRGRQLTETLAKRLTEEFTEGWKQRKSTKDAEPC